MSLQKLKEYINLTSEYELISLLEDITRGVYGDITRSKGYIKIQNKTYHFEISNNIYNLVFILEKK